MLRTRSVECYVRKVTAYDVQVSFTYPLFVFVSCATANWQLQVAGVPSGSLALARHSGWQAGTALALAVALPVPVAVKQLNPMSSLLIKATVHKK